MQVETKNVRYDRKIVGQVDVPVYENLEELTGAEEADYIVSQFNKGNTITLMGIERNKHKPKTLGKQKRIWIALNLLTEEELMSVRGDEDALQALVMSDKIQARVDAKIAEEGGDADEDDESE